MMVEEEALLITVSALVWWREVCKTKQIVQSVVIHVVVSVMPWSILTSTAVALLLNAYLSKRSAIYILTLIDNNRVQQHACSVLRGLPQIHQRFGIFS
jgi:hypothetical protein